MAVDEAGVRAWMGQWFGFVRDDRLDEAARDFVSRFGVATGPAEAMARVRSAAADPESANFDTKPTTPSSSASSVPRSEHSSGGAADPRTTNPVPVGHCPHCKGRMNGVECAGLLGADAKALDRADAYIRELRDRLATFGAALRSIANGTASEEADGPEEFAEDLRLGACPHCGAAGYLSPVTGKCADIKACIDRFTEAQLAKQCTDYPLRVKPNSRRQWIAFETISGNAQFSGDSRAEVQSMIDHDRRTKTDPEHGYPWDYTIVGPFVLAEEIPRTETARQARPPRRRSTTPSRNRCRRGTWYVAACLMPNAVAHTVKTKRPAPPKRRSTT